MTSKKVMANSPVRWPAKRACHVLGPRALGLCEVTCHSRASLPPRPLSISLRQQRQDIVELKEIGGFALLRNRQLGYPAEKDVNLGSYLRSTLTFRPV
jgi:hypothetical protein